MGFISNALGFNNSYTNTSGAGPNTTAQQQTDETNLANAISGQGTLASQLLAQAQGQGPNIANLQLQQATNQNNQQAAGMLASQRGMNPALAQRIISQQNATNNQNAAGQSGVLRAQQQLAAQQGLGNVYAQQAGEAAQNLNTLTQAQTAANNSNAAAAGQNAQTGAGLVGGILGGVSSLFAKGGQVEPPEKHLERLLISIGSKIRPKKYDDGGMVSQSYNGSDPANDVVDTANAVSAATPIQATPSGPSFLSGMGSSIGSSLQNGPAMQQTQSPAFANVPLPPAAASNQFSNVGGVPLTQLHRAHGGAVPAMVSPGERFIPPEYVHAVKSGKVKASKVAPKFPGKAKVKGDSEQNDNIPANLEEGGVVVPRTKADNDNDSREFLQAIAEEKRKKSGPSGFNKVLEARRKRAS
jgi:hypothetical protein